MEMLTIFIGSLLDALIGPNLVVQGEPFLLLAGYQLHEGTASGVLAVLCGGFIGDQCSFLLGRKTGLSIRRRLIRWQPKIRRLLARCRLLLQKRGNAVMAFSRLLGPVAWVMPFMAGMQRISWRRFTIFSTVGLFLGIGQFIAAGWLLAAGMEQFALLESWRLFIAEHQQFLLLVLCALLLLAAAWKWRRRTLMATALVLLCGGTALLNYNHFFQKSDDIIQTAVPPARFSMAAVNWKVYPGKSKIYDAQALNVLYIGKNPATMMMQLGWLKNKTFSRDEIGIEDYLTLLYDRTPPVSDLFWNGIPQNQAWQLPGSLSHRTHIRWWLAGKEKESGLPVWLGAVSYDSGLRITLHNGIPTLLHAVDPDVDAQRNRLAAQLQHLGNQWNIRQQPIAQTVRANSEHAYNSDGKVLCIQEVKVTGSQQQIADKYLLAKK